MTPKFEVGTKIKTLHTLFCDDEFCKIPNCKMAAGTEALIKSVEWNEEEGEFDYEILTYINDMIDYVWALESSLEKVIHS